MNDIVYYILLYFLGGISLVLLISLFPELFKKTLIYSLSSLKASSLRIKYEKEWTQELDDDLKINLKEYEKSLDSKITLDPNMSQKSKLGSYFVFLLLWIVLVLIVFLALFFQFFNIYQTNKIKKEQK
jgi:hypothetical protein